MAAVYDSVGKATFEQSLACLKPRGTFVLYGSAMEKFLPSEVLAQVLILPEQSQDISTPS